MGIQIVPKDEFLGFIGHKFEAGEWFELSQERINDFADCTEDHQFIHIDQEKAAQTPFGGTIAHGFLTLSALVPMTTGVGVAPEGVMMGVNYGFDKVRFLAPVRAGKRVRAHMEIADIQAKDANRFLIKQNVSVEIEGEDTPALVAEWLSMVVVA
jgi:acyl dehydratase